MRAVAEADITAGTGEAVNPASVETIPEEAMPLAELSKFRPASALCPLSTPRRMLAAVPCGAAWPAAF